MIRDLLRRSTSHFLWMGFAKAISVVAFILLAQSLTTELFGRFLFFLTALSLVSILGSLGLNQWYQKQVSSGQSVGVVIQQVFLARAVSWFLSTLLLGLWLVFVPSLSLELGFLLVIVSLPEAFLSVTDGVWLFMKQPWLVSIPNILKMSSILVGLLVFGDKITVFEVVLFFGLGSLVACFLFLILLKRRVLLERQVLFSISQALSTLKQASSYALLMTTSYAYSRADQLIIRYSLSEAALGVYGIAYRYLEGISLFPNALAQNLFHVAAKKNAVSLLQVLIITSILFVLGVFFGGVVFLLAPFLTTGLLGAEYSQATTILQILSLVVVMFFVNAPLSTVVQSSDLVTRFLPWGITNTVLNISLNLIFLPVYGLQAAAWMMVVTEFTGLVINMYFVTRLFRK